jgi:hypothetical protein
MNVKLGVAVGLVLCLGTSLVRSDNKPTGNQEAAGVSEEVSAAAKVAAATGCDGELWSHVYRKSRLHVVESCIAVTGTVRHIKRESDGDDHIQLAVDPEFAKLLNQKNKTAQGNTLVLEPICQGPPMQPDAQAACADFHSVVTIPRAGEKIRVLGSYVQDAGGGGWMEIHPVSTITVTH